MYTTFYKLSEKPFQIIPNPSFLYPSPNHKNALAYLEYGIMEQVGFILLTGEVGSGKTTLIRHLLNKVDRRIDTAVIFNTNITSHELLQLILKEFEIDAPECGKSQALEHIFDYLIERFAHNRRVLLIIDEAQNLSEEALEEVRMLSNLQSDDQLLLQIMLVGQPELNDKLKRHELRQLNQRIAANYHLSGISLEDTEHYIRHRLLKVGRKNRLFTNEAIALIHTYSGGIPRTINLICDTALVYGFADEIELIDAELIRSVIRDKNGIGIRDESAAPAAPAEVELIDRVAELTTEVERLQRELEQARSLQADQEIKRLRNLIMEERENHQRLQERYDSFHSQVSHFLYAPNSNKSTKQNLLRRLARRILGLKEVEEFQDQLEDSIIIRD